MIDITNSDLKKSYNQVKNELNKVKHNLNFRALRDREMNLRLALREIPEPAVAAAFGVALSIAAKNRWRLEAPSSLGPPDFCCASCLAYSPNSARPPSLVHASQRVPPHELTTTPIGPLFATIRSRPKKYATAENDAATSGVQICHWPSSWSVG